MNEISRKRREWVKTAVIVFLTVMLLLTFFSNTIMNYSLPEVAAQYVQSGSITAKIRGNGVVESGDPYNVMVKQTRKVMSVAVKTGDQVQKGDVLLYLEDGDSEELKAAQEALEAAQNAYDLALLTAEVDAGIISNANKNISSSTYRQQINAAQAEIDKAQAEVDEWQKKYDEVSVELTLANANYVDVSGETEALNNAQKNLNAKKSTQQEKQNRVDLLSSLYDFENNTPKIDFSLMTEADWQKYGINYTVDVSSGDITPDIEGAKRVADKELFEASSEVVIAQSAYDNAATALEQKQNSGDNSAYVKSLQEKQALMQVNLDATTKTLEEKKQALSELTGNINTTLTLETLYDAVVDAQELVNEEIAKTTDAVVTADIAGTIMQINAVAGKEVSAAEAVAIIQPEGQGYTMSFTVTNEQARRLSVGDKAELINSWYYDDMDITLKSMRPDPANPSQQKQLIFDVAGNVTAGQNLNVSVGQKSANYDLIVPNSAIREDNNGKFVLSVESKSSPLGNRYIATRVDVEVLASDDTQSAISGALYGWEFVITTSTKPVEAGQQVRLAEN